MTVEDVIQAGRDEHPAFERRWTPNKLVLAFLSRWQQTLLSRIAQLKPDALVSTQQIPLPLDPWDGGVALEPHILVHGGEVVFKDGNRDPGPLEFVGFEHRLTRPIRVWGAYVAAGTLHLVGREEDWNPVERVDVKYFPRPAVLQNKASEFVLPGQALDAAVSAAADFLAKRTPGGSNPPVNHERIAMERAAAEELYIDEVSGRKRVVSSETREVW